MSRPARDAATDWLEARAVASEETLRAALTATRGNISAAARDLGIARQHATKLVRRFKLRTFAADLRETAGCARQRDGRVLGRIPGT